MQYLNHQEISELNNIKRAIEDNIIFTKVSVLCDSVSKNSEEKEFPYIYAGLLYAEKHNIPNALQILKRSENNKLALPLMQYLIQYKTLLIEKEDLDLASAFNLFTKTKVWQDVTTNISDACLDLALKVKPCDNDIPTILEVGAGNGYSILEIAKKILEKFKLKKIRLILLDKSINSLHKAESYCKSKLGEKVEIELVPGLLPNLSPKNISALERNGKIWITNCSLSLHHIKKNSEKQKAFELLRKYSKSLLLSEINCNIQDYLSWSPEYVYNTYLTFYYFFEDKESISLLSEDEKREIYSVLHIPKFVNQLRNSQERIDYTWTEEEWKTAAIRAGFSIIAIHPIFYYKNGTHFVSSMQFI